MRDLLSSFYAIQISEEIFIEERVGFISDDSIYFTISATNNKAIHMEQSLLAYHLVDNGYGQIAYPVPNYYGEWITNYRDGNYIVLKVTSLGERIRSDHGKLLAQFHQKNNTYTYEPRHISSYGQWKKLWIDKLTIFENKIIEESQENKNDYYRLLINVLPYIIGISENAIQYMGESEREIRHNQSDQGTITFQRYYDQLISPVIWHTDLVYDHLARDLAEFIRYQFLQNREQSFDDVIQFLNDYQSVQPLSIFSWRLLYARLIYPIHLLDFIEHAFLEGKNEYNFQKLTELLDKQEHYQHCLCQLFQKIGIDTREMHIPVLQWL